MLFRSGDPRLSLGQGRGETVTVLHTSSVIGFMDGYQRHTTWKTYCFRLGFRHLSRCPPLRFTRASGGPCPALVQPGRPAGIWDDGRMGLLMLDDTRFVGHAVVRAAVGMGRDVTTFNRGLPTSDVARGARGAG